MKSTVGSMIWEEIVGALFSTWRVRSDMLVAPSESVELTLSSPDEAPRRKG